MNETIAAIATAPGEGGIAIIRISGPKALRIAGKIFSGPVESYASHTAHAGKILDIVGNAIDEGMLLLMRAPRSYTGEDVVELHCHGGSLISRRVLESALLAGAKLASPGEFTLRAYLNGKMDLAQAEAVQEIIAAKNDAALAAAQNQLRGKLSACIENFQSDLLDIAATLEAWVDFPEEDLAFASRVEILDALRRIEGRIKQLIDTFEQGKMLSEGICLCILGPPNAGKSSLMNALLGFDRAIVTEIPGTTRDLLEEPLRLCGLHLRLIDTAGVRETADVIECEGIARSRGAAREADLLLLVLDSSKEPSKEEIHWISSLPMHKTIVLYNKCDLPSCAQPPLGFATPVRLSAKTGEGLDELERVISKHIWKNGVPDKEEVLLTHMRHKEALEKAALSLSALIHGIESDFSPELLSIDMRSALTELSRVIGMDITEDILSTIFSKFCVGK